MASSNTNTKFPVTAHVAQAEDFRWMKLALDQAENAAEAGEVPIGAVIVSNGQLMASAHNAPISRNDACAHAEIQAIQQACQASGNYRLGSNATLYVTLQPCLMCLGAILHARIGRVVVGCAQSRYNDNLENALQLFEQSQAWHPCQFETDCMAAECETVLTQFFKAHRKQREEAVRDLASLMNLPNVNKNTVEILGQLGYRQAEDILQRGLEQVVGELKVHSAKLLVAQERQQAAILASLCDYFNGEPVRSWKQYL
ncbi:tRNA(Arg) A34 adenosine deaminase TadA [Limnobacter thiooxidans]|nr:tRNA(Arg) A34 adenosine deaminase TadA [Limnobacter thiooxidans]